MRMEYRVRRSVARALPVLNRVEYDSLVHCCSWKTGSQWVRLVLSDPRFYVWTGLKPRPMIPRKELEVAPERYRVNSGEVVTNVFCNAEIFNQIAKPDDFRAFFVCRDPVTLLISWYYSARYSHPDNADLKSFRRATEGMNDEEGLMYAVSQSEKALSDLKSWANYCAQDRSIPLVKFEDLVGADKLTHWADLFERLGISIPTRIVDSILKTYSRERLSPRGGGLNDKYSSAWKERIKDKEIEMVRAELRGRMHGLRSALGYNDA